MNLAFYLGIGFAVMTVSLQAAVEAKRRMGIDVLHQVMNIPMLASSLLMLCVWVLGTRVAFSRPLDLRANWLFRVTPMYGSALCLSAVRRALLALSVFPVWLGCAALFLRFWPWQAVTKHLLLFGLFGSLLVELSLAGFRKIPFTCSYLPGKSKLHIMFLACVLFLPIALLNCVKFEQWPAADWSVYCAAVVILAGAAFAVRRFANMGADSSGPEIQFEESASDELTVLGLNG